jgi:tetratricopeptide (TPR) repeat protein
MSAPQFGDNTIDDYIQRLSNLNQERPQTLSQDELEGLALEVGIAPEILAKAHDIAQSSFEAGLRYQQEEHWDAAIAAFEQSLSLRPCDPESLYQLAAAHHDRYRATRHPADAERAEALVQQCLNHDPHHAAAADLRQAIQTPLEPLAETAPPTTSPTTVQQRLTRTGMALGGGLLLLLAVIGGAELLNEPGPTSGVTGTEAEAETEDTIEAASDAFPLASADQYGTRVELPIEVADSVTSLGINIAPRESQFSIHNNGKAYYKLEAFLVNDGTQEVQEAQLTISFRDSNNTLLATKNQRALTASDPALRPGDSFPIITTLAAHPNTASVEFSLHSIDSVPAATSYDPGQEIPVVWDIPQPSHLALQALERQFRVRYNSFGNEDFAQGTFALTNTGDAVFNQLTLELRIYDAEGEILDTRLLYIASDSYPALWQAETRLRKAVLALPPGRFYRYELAVVDAE